MPPTFYAPGLTPPTYTLPEDESRHAVRVLRLAAGDAVELVNGQGGVYQAEVTDAHPKRCQLRLTAAAQVPRRPYSVHVAVAPTKSLDRMEWLVEKATEVGVDQLSFLRCARSERRELKLDRLEKIAVSALKQSGQAWLPRLAALTDFADFLPTLDPATTFLAHLADNERTELARVAGAGPACCVLIGPEGDFTPEEIAVARQLGIRPVALGRARLRTETAALAAVFTAHIARQLSG